MICIDAEQLQDGLYNIKDGKIYKYKAKGGTVRAYKLENRPQGEWLDTGKDPDHSHPLTAIWYRCSVCGDGTNAKTNFCPDCGAEMKGEDDEDN